MTEIKPTDIKGNLIKLISKDWMLVTAGSIDRFNTMTASWGMMGEMWGMDVAEVVIRPQRYTNEFIESNARFTMSFFPDSMKPLLTAMGTKSGRDIDKMHYPGLEAVELPSGSLTFKGAKLVIECEKIYVDRFNPDAFIDKSIIDRWYEGDFHYRYIGKIVGAWVDDNDK